MSIQADNATADISNGFDWSGAKGEGPPSFHPLGWYRGLSSNARAAFWSCFGGVTLDAMDMRIFSFLIPSLMINWGASEGQLGLLGGVAMISAAAGGWASGLLSDRFGRVRVLQITILIYAFFTFLSGFTENVTQLTVTRAFQGIGYGGEITAGIVLMAEIVRPENRGTAVGCLQSGFAFGWALAAIISGLLLSALPAAWGWRATFWVGLVPAFLIIGLRRIVKEPLHHRPEIQTPEIGIKRVLAIFRAKMAPTTILVSLLSIGIQGSAIATSTWLPSYLKTVHHLSPGHVGLYIGIVTLGALLGYVASAYLSDIVGRRPIFFLYTAGNIIILAIYLFAPVPSAILLPSGLLVGFFSQGIYANLGSFVTELYPTHVRANGTSFAYGIGRLGAAGSVALVGMLAHRYGIGLSLYGVLLLAYFMILLPVVILRETRGTVMDI